MMLKNIPIGVDNFAKLLDPECNYLFVDKSLFIQEIIDDRSEVTLITRPRRWGKTLNLSMLEYFLSNETSGLRLPLPSQRHVRTLQIAHIDHGRYLKYLGQYPVIFISFKDVKESTFNQAIQKIRELIQDLFERYEGELLGSSQLSESKKRRFRQYLEGQIEQPEMEGSLLNLSRWLFEHYQGKKVYILIDEYDTPLNNAYIKHYVEELTQFMKNLLGAALKGNPFLQKGVMTGILRISKDSMLSGLNNVKVHSMMDDRRYTAHFGFTEEEVSRLLAEVQLPQEIEAIRCYYNGYCILDQMLYNPWSIMQCLDEQGELTPYWVNTADDTLLKQLILGSNAAIKEQIAQLLEETRGSIQGTLSPTIRFEDLMQWDEIALWSLLVATGYLTPRRVKRVRSNYLCDLVIPNEEVKSVYTTIFTGWLSEQLGDATYRQLLQALMEGHVEIFTKKLEDYLLVYGSSHDFTRESNYHTFLLGLLCGLLDEYHLYSNLETGLGRVDFMLIPKQPSYRDFAIIVELKHLKNTRHVNPDLLAKMLLERALEGLEQMTRQRYAVFLQRHPLLMRVLKIGFAFSGKIAVSCYRWDDVLHQPMSALISHESTSTPTLEEE